MSFLIDLINPPAENASKYDQYKFDNGVLDVIQALTYIANPSMLTNANFATVGSLYPAVVTQADLDGAEFSHDWNVFGASNATYALTTETYPTGAIANGSPSLIQSASPYYIRVQASAWNGNPFYFYQKQLATVRKYQKNFLSYGIWIYNSLSTTPRIKMQIHSYYDTATSTIDSKPIYLKPGLNKLTALINTETLAGKTIGAGNYTEFRLAFIDFGGSTIDLNMHQIKCEFGKISTLLQ